MTLSINAQRWFADLQSLVIKIGAVASLVTGAVTAFNNDAPHYESAIISGVGAAVFLAERYWRDVKKAI